MRNQTITDKARLVKASKAVRAQARAAGEDVAKARASAKEGARGTSGSA